MSRRAEPYPLSRISDFRLPGISERAVVFGRNGSGKTRMLIWLLSHASIETIPWVIVDYKKDKELVSLPRVKKIKVGELPRHPGVYIMQPSLRTDIDTMDEYFHRVLEQGNVGIFTDEGKSVPQQEPRYTAFAALLAQGRSKRTPVLFATQRPAWINKSLLSEGDYYALFHLQNADDKERVHKFMPPNIETRLDDYHSHWYDVKQDKYFVLGPVSQDETLERFEERLKPRRTFL